MRLRYHDGYHGSSFMELLDAELPSLRPDFSKMLVGGDVIPTSHGTTVLAVRFEEGVLVAGDRLATMDYRVASREIEKVFSTDNYSLMAVAGAAGPAIEMARLLRVQLEHYEKIEGESLEIEGKANTLSQLIKQNLPAAMQGLVVVPLFAGYDFRRSTGRLWRYEITGGRYEERDYESVGSGSLFARESLKKAYKGVSDRESALRVALEALDDAADEDRGTGGVDTIRNIFPKVKSCTKQGVEAVGDEEIARVHAEIVEARRESQVR